MLEAAVPSPNTLPGEAPRLLLNVGLEPNDAAPPNAGEPPKEGGLPKTGALPNPPVQKDIFDVHKMFCNRQKWKIKYGIHGPHQVPYKRTNGGKKCESWCCFCDFSSFTWGI